jgi:hypothetical protein
MGSPFLMPRNAAHAVSKAAGAGAATPSPFDFSAQQWTGVRNLLDAVGQLGGTRGAIPGAWPRALAQVESKSRISLFVQDYAAFAAVAMQFDRTILPGLLQLANAVVNYGTNVAPALYAQLKDVLAPLETRAPTAQDRATFNQILAQCNAAATAAAAAAAQFGGPVSEFAQRAVTFKTQADATPELQHVQIIPDVGGAVSMGASDDHTMVMGRNTNAKDPLQLWTLLYDEGEQAYRLAISIGGSEHCAVQQSQHVKSVFMDLFSQKQVQLVPLAQNNVLATTGAFWLFDVDVDKQKLLLKLDTRFCMDISGNSGWGQGTPVLSFLINDGGNQHWSFQPKPYYPWDCTFLGFVCPIAAIDSAASIANLQTIVGAWNTICGDLADVAQDIGKMFDIGQPFISGINADAAVAEWKSLAVEAANFQQNSGGLN